MVGSIDRDFVINPIKHNKITNQKKIIRSDQLKKRDTISLSSPTIEIEKLDPTTIMSDSKEYSRIKNIAESFGSSPLSWGEKGQDLAFVYDISEYKELFPLEIEPAKVLSSISSTGNENCYDLYLDDTKGGKIRLRIMLGEDFKNEPMDEGTFKNTILKGFLIMANEKSLSLKSGNKVTNDTVAKLEYDSSTKTVNLDELVDAYREDYNKVISQEFTEKFIKDYKGYIDLDEDPDQVRERWSQLSIIFDSILKLKF